MTESDPIDRAVYAGLVDSVGGDPEFLTELRQAYLDDTPRLLDAMHAALADGSAADFRGPAHTLKSTSASLGAMTLSRMARALEEMGKAGALEGATAGLAQAEAEWERVEAALRQAIV